MWIEMPRLAQQPLLVAQCPPPIGRIVQDIHGIDSEELQDIASLWLTHLHLQHVHYQTCHVTYAKMPYVLHPLWARNSFFSAQLFGTWRPEGCCTTWEVHRWKAMEISDVTGKLQPLANWTTWHLWNMEWAKNTTWVKDSSQHPVVHFITSVYPSSVSVIKIPMGLKSTAWGWPEIYASSQHVWKVQAQSLLPPCKQSIQSQCIETIQVDSNQNDNYIVHLLDWMCSKRLPICMEYDSSNTWAARHQ